MNALVAGGGQSDSCACQGIGIRLGNAYLGVGSNNHIIGIAIIQPANLLTIQQLVDHALTFGKAMCRKIRYLARRRGGTGNSR